MTETERERNRKTERGSDREGETKSKRDRKRARGGERDRVCIGVVGSLEDGKKTPNRLQHVEDRRRGGRENAKGTRKQKEKQTKTATTRSKRDRKSVV